jgi:hypothetical protein
MKRIVRLTESDLTRIVRRVISESEKPAAKDYFVNENHTSMPGGTNFYAVTGLGAPTPIKDGKYKSFQVAVSGIQYYSNNGTWQKSGNFSEKLQHRCGAKSNFWAKESNGGIPEVDTGSAGFVSKIGGGLELASNKYCNTVGAKNQSSMGII